MKPQHDAGPVGEGPLALQRNGLISLRKPQGWRIECCSGNVWITHDGDLHDTLLGPGQSHLAQGPQRLLLQALDDCELQLSRVPSRRATRPVAHAVPEPAGGLQRWLRRAWPVWGPPRGVRPGS